jgi:S-(hydroxymethyl)mycothiol dehydrogenase
MLAQGVIVRKVGEPRVEEFVVDDPGPDEVLVRIEASGVCHTDLLYQEGQAGDNYPFLLGHEGAGVVEKVGPGVENPQVGDHVILAWRGPCGQCRFCRIGLLPWCSNNLNADKSRLRTQDGQNLTTVGGVGTFCNYTVVNAAQAISVSKDIPFPQASLIGCGVMTGIGAVFYTAGVRPGSSVAVFGCGGVGASAIQGARLAHAQQIIAVDIAPQKLEEAKLFGATHTVNVNDGDPVAQIKELTGGNGANYTFECAGRVETLEQALWSRDLAGVCVMIGMQAPGATLALPLQQFFGLGGSLRVSWYGDCLPARDFPMLADWYLKGELKLDELVSGHIHLGQTAEAYQAMHDGKTMRSVIVFDGQQ